MTGLRSAPTFRAASLSSGPRSAVRARHWQPATGSTAPTTIRAIRRGGGMVSLPSLDGCVFMRSYLRPLANIVRPRTPADMRVDFGLLRMFVGRMSRPVSSSESTAVRKRGVVILSTVIASSLFGCERPDPPTPPEPGPRPVDVITVTLRDLPVQFEFIGRTESSQRVEIRPRIDGYLEEIVYAEGEFVEEGDVMFRIDDAPFESRLRAARAELAQQEARLTNAEALLERITPLAEADAVADKEVDDATGRVREAAAAVEAAGAGVYDAELNLGYTTITAPVRGLTGSSVEREGAYITGLHGPLTYVARIDPMWVEFSVSEAQVLKSLRSQQDGTVIVPENQAFDIAIELADGTRHPYTGRLSFADASISTETGTVLVRADMPNPDETLRPGQYVRVYVRGAYRPGAVGVPRRAVFEGPRGSYVWVVTDDGTAEQRPVSLGPWIEDIWVIESGLVERDRIIVSGTVGLAPGTPLAPTLIGGNDPGATPGDDTANATDDRR